MGYKSEGWLIILDKAYLAKAGSRQYDRIRFTYLTDNFTESKSANYSATSILGRSEPVRGYLSSSARAINLQLAVPLSGDEPEQVKVLTPKTWSTLSFGDERTADFQNGEFVTQKAETQADIGESFKRKLEVLDFIRSLTYPHYTADTQKIVQPPPRVQVILGTWFSLVGILMSYSMTHRSPWAPEGDMTPYFTDVSLTIEECDQPYSFQDVYGGILRTGGATRKQVGPLTSGI